MLGLLAVLALQVGCRSTRPTPEPEDLSAQAAFADTTKITFTDRSGDRAPIVISDPAQVRSIIATLRLVPDPGALYHDCLRSDVAVFARPEGQLRICFGPDCCEVIKGDVAPNHGFGKYYRTPKTFYARFLALPRTAPPADTDRR